MYEYISCCETIYLQLQLVTEIVIDYLLDKLFITFITSKYLLHIFVSLFNKNILSLIKIIRKLFKIILFLN